MHLKNLAFLYREQRKKEISIKKNNDDSKLFLIIFSFINDIYFSTLIYLFLSYIFKKR